MGLHARFGFTQEDIGEMLDFADRWQDDAVVGGAIFPVIADLGGQHLPDGDMVLPDLDPGMLARFQAGLMGYLQRYPDGPMKLSAPQDADLIEVIRAQFIAHAGSLDRAAELVRAGQLPLGALAAAASRPYASMLVEQACGPIYAVSADHEALAREVEAAAAAINAEVVAEASILAVLTLLPERAPALLPAFTAVRLPRPALTDIEAAWGELTGAPGFSYSVSYDPEHDVLVSRSVSLAEHQQFYRRITDIDKVARTLVVTDLGRTASPPDAHEPWLAAIDLTAERELPLWSDDIAIRSIAAEKGISAFGTWALLTALIEGSLIPDTRPADALALAEAGVIQLPLTNRESSA
jgi:hypothetical protein